MKRWFAIGVSSGIGRAIAQESRPTRCKLALTNSVGQNAVMRLFLSQFREPGGQGVAAPKSVAEAVSAMTEAHQPPPCLPPATIRNRAFMLRAFAG